MQKHTLDENELALLWLHYFALSEKKRDAVLGLFAEPKDIFLSFDKQKDLVSSIVGHKTFEKMTQKPAKAFAQELKAKIDKLNIFVVTRASANYPASLREISNAPLVLFAIGDISLLSQTLIAVVGTRKPTSYGKEVAKSFSTTLAKAGVVLVSGLAYGVDCIAHMTAIEEGSKTVAVMAGGLDEIYPAAHTTLARQIVKTGGLILSEYFPGVRPTSYSFPERNRIVSGISDGVLVIEAGEKSGSLHTVGFAIDQGKELFVVPANINSVASKGSNRVLVEVPHALVTEPSQILERLGIFAQEERENILLSDEEKMILKVVLREPLDFDNLAQKTKIPTQNLNSLLTIMEMNGIIKRLPGNIIEATGIMEIE